MIPGRTRFGFSANPAEGESLPGFVMRVAGALRFDRADRLAGMAGLRQPGSAVSSSGLGRLAAIAGTTTESLEGIAYRPSGRFAHHAFLGGSVHRELIDLSRRRLCPRCIGAAPYHRACWDFGLVTACPVHGVRLIDVCPGCGRKLAWRRPNLRFCSCGLDLSGFKGKAVEAAEARACARLTDMVGGGPACWLAGPLAACDRSDLTRLAMCLGMFATGWSRERRIETLVNSGPDAVAAVVRAGMEALEDWPATLHGFLSEARKAEGGRSGRYGAKKALGAFYGWLTLMEPGEVKSALAAAARDFVTTDAALHRRVHRSRLLASPGEAGPVVGLNEAAAILAVSGGSVKAMMATGKLPAVVSEGRGIPMTLSRKNVDALAGKLASVLTLADAATMLGISKGRVRRLVEAGIVHADGGPGAGGRTGRALDGTAIEALLNPPRAAGPAGCPGRMVTFDHAAEVLRRGGLDFPGFVGLIVTGRLQVVGTDTRAVGLKRHVFDRATIRSCRDALTRDDAVTLQGAARRLGLKWEVVAHLVKVGLIGTAGGKIGADQLDAFRQAFISGAELARVRGTSPRHVAATMARAKIFPVTGAGVDGGRQNFYRRVDLDGGPETPAPSS